MNPYRTFLDELVRLVKDGKDLPLGGFEPLPHKEPASNAPKVLIFSPHPDDEVIIGGLPLRMSRELNFRIINVAVTQGSNPQRQAARWKELQNCCEHIGFDLIQTRRNGLEHVNLRSRENQPESWDVSVKRIAEILGAEQPHSIFFPHDDDWNGTHIGTHHLVVDALKLLGPKFECLTVETEFWGAMDDPNLMVESSVQDVTDLITALTFHVGEVRRNPYHLLLAGWLMDNVRRGGELVGGQGGAAPDFTFATLYRLRRWKNQLFQNVWDSGRFLSSRESVASLFADGVPRA